MNTANGNGESYQKKVVQGTNAAMGDGEEEFKKVSLAEANFGQKL